MATKPGALTEYPWTSLGAWKYTLFLPFAAKAVQTNLLGGHEVDNWCFHMLLSSALRYLHGQAWMSLSRCHWLTGKYRIQTKGINFDQVDRESNWDDYILLHIITATLVHEILPGFANFPVWDLRGIAILLLLHAGPTEFLYYWLHRALHHHFLYNKYHSHHHASFVTEPVSGSVHPFAEHLMYTATFALPFLGTWALGGASIGMFYFYWLFFDFMNAIGHCNFEFFPTWMFRVFPPLKYLVYTPTFHSLHHSHVHTNFALFMPLYDYLGGTADKVSDELYEQVREGKQEKPDFVFLAHGTELLSTFHLPFGIPSFAAWPYAPKWFIWPLWPLTLPILAILWLFGKPFTSDTYKLKHLRTETWVVPRFGFQYFLPFEKKRINRLIEHAILSAQKKGVRVISLGALNKNESLNGGGTLFVQKHKDLRIRVVHGNTLTAAVILNEIPKDVKEIFLTGATSKLGRAIALYFCHRGVRVLMLTTSRDRFEMIQSELAPQHRENMIQVTKYQAGQNCKRWVLGKWATPSEQKWAPPGTHFHQFVVPPVMECRKDCTYGKLSAMQVPKEMKGLRSCEMTMPRGVVHACHAGGLVHALEGWEFHEVGAIDVGRIDETWAAALKQGFKPVC
ncbi:very-long-chain aldehyde decarbonylase GL1-1 [Physcomitrium patens]|uniref:Uncharacterized protein n=1 Tax=Physcomitrium patens TaxID=3218 RepID=A0A2K1JTP0_PHYPA|nr:protein ECERIFERUM 3-like [Physcomitrium patens]PNR44892.1 hypothetical protein PHYPA_014662 [Physcomitrium patens]|eukprot:XP_024387740.1 protein ECERIFERUM 3-like [Physcomitrella patens]